ncbi:MAG: AraC family transcriptional regulator [Armatimonadia bacterium]
MSFRMMGDQSYPEWEDSDPAPDLTADLAYVAVAGRDYRASWPMQALPGYELAYVMDGALLLWLEDRCLRAGSGDMLVVPPRTPHREETPEDSFSEVIYLGTMLRAPSGRGRVFPLPIAPLLHLGRGNIVEQRLLQIVAEVQQRAPGYTRIVSGAVLEVFWHLARATAGIAPPEADRPTTLALPNFAREAQDYLTRHYAEPLSIDDVARHFHLSRQYFSKLFRRFTEQSPHSYLTQIRLQQARALLDDTKLTIQEVAARVGFADPYYFARAFRVHCGLTPTQYRNRERETGR